MRKKRTLIVLLLFVTAPLLYSCKSVDINEYMLFSYLDDKDNIRSDIRLRTTVKDQAVMWSSSNDEVINNSGKVFRTKDLETVTLTAKTADSEVSFKMKVLPLTKDKLLNLYPNLKEEKHMMKEYDESKVLEALTSDELKVIYLGFPSCPYCREYITYFYNVAKDMQINEIIYNDIYESRLEYQNTKEGFIKEVIDILNANDIKLPKKEVEGVKIDWIFAPTFIIVNEGEIRGFFTGAIENHNAGLRHLTVNERNIFINDVAGMINYARDKDCGC